MNKKAVITGAFSFTGAAVAAELIRRGWKVHTLTNRTRPPEAGEITSSPLTFDPAYLQEQLQAADLFINTYWVRLPWNGITFQTGIDNSKLLVQAAVEAKVPRFVHVSVSRAEKGMNLGYYRGKNEVENFITQSGLSYGIVCPTLALGPHDVLTNNIAWFLRRFPFFPVPQGGHYRLQPVTLNDMGRIIADAGESRENLKVDAAGPELLTYREFLGLLAEACGVKPIFINAPNWLALAGIRLVESFVGDIILTREELLGLQQELLCSDQPPLGKESAVEWLKQNGDRLGRVYANDVKRHFGSDASKPVIPKWQ
ncbi:MAG: NmrA family NAD(P)-binding protein [Terriglobales bacterium]